MLLEGRRDEQSAFQAKDVESKEATVADANRIITDTSRTEKRKVLDALHVEEHTPIMAHVLQKARNAITVVK